MNQKLALRIFISSPSDVAEERALAARVFRRLASEFADTVTLETILWEHEPLFAHSGFQQEIEKIARPSQCDLVVCILWARLGTRLPKDYAPEPGRPPPTGTEFEIRDALAAYEKFGRPNLLIYRKKAPPHVNLASPDAEERFRQYKQLDEFCRSAFYDAQGASLVAHHGFNDGPDFERRFTEHARKWIARELEKAGEHRLRPRWTRGSPFRGLQAFDAEYQDVFFGRSRAVGELICRLHGTESEERPEGPRARLLLIDGMSGNGKSSLVRAGLLPFLADRPVEGIASWYTVMARPSDVDREATQAGALGAIAAAISAALPAVASLGVSVAQLAAQLHTAPLVAAARIETYLAAEATAHRISPEQVRLLIYVDQLEEIFTLPAVSTQARSILEAISALAVVPTVWVVVTMRSDFTHRLEAYPAIMELLRRSPPYTLPPPRGDELLDMIREPALAAGLEFEERDGVSLDRELWKDASQNPESLPLLEYALQQLYEGRVSNLLLWEVYKPADREGGLRAALIAEAERLLAADGPDGSVTFRRVMRELTSVAEDGSATRRYAPIDAFPHGSPEQAFVDRLIGARLAVTDRHGDRSVVCLAHEALLQSWPRARGWLQHESALLMRRDELQHDASAWDSHRRSAGWLGTAPDKLAAIAQLEREGLVPTGAATEYAARSRSRARNMRFLKHSAITTVVLLMVSASVFAWIAVAQRNAAKAAEARAQLEASTARATTDFLVGLFQEVDPSHSRGETLLAREVVDKGRSKLEHSLMDQPAVRTELLRTIGTVYDNLGLTTEGEQTLRKALKLAEQTPAVPPLELARARYALAFAIVDSGKFTEAEKLYLDAIHYYDTQPNLRLDAATARGNLGYLYYAWGRCREADQVQSTAYASAVKMVGARSELASGIEFDMGRVAICLGDPAKGLAEMEEAAEIRKQLFGINDVWYAAYLYEIGFALRDLQHPAEAARYFSASVPILERLLGPEHPWLAIALSGYGSVLTQEGRYSDGIRMMERSVEISKRAGKAADPRVLQALGFILGELEDYKSALPYLKEAVDADAKVGGDQNRAFYAMELGSYGFYLTLSGKSQEATPILRQALSIVEHDAPNNAVALREVRLYLAVNVCYSRRDAEGFALTTAVLGMTVPGEAPWQHALDKAINAACDPDSTHFRLNEATLRSSLGILTHERGPHDGLTRALVRTLITFYQRAGLPNRAAYYQRQLSSTYALPTLTP
jgi:tetratricopeptide (TPR) repeat protein